MRKVDDINNCSDIIQGKIIKNCYMEKDIIDIKNIANSYGMNLIHIKHELGSDKEDDWYDEFLLIGPKNKNHLFKKCYEDLRII